LAGKSEKPQIAESVAGLDLLRLELYGQKFLDVLDHLQVFGVPFKKQLGYFQYIFKRKLFCFAIGEVLVILHQELLLLCQLISFCRLFPDCCFKRNGDLLILCITFFIVL
jgi:hypothetical protein